MKRKLLKTFCLFLCLALLPGCGAGTSSAPEAEGPSPAPDTPAPATPTPPPTTEPPADTPEPEPGPEAPAAEGPGVASPATSGRLHVEGTQLTDANGNPIQLRGFSTHGLAWFPQYVNEDFFSQLRYEWGANAVRLAMYTAESGGYCTDGDKNALKALIRDGVAWATAQDLYVIIDWHILSDGDPNIHIDESRAFWDEMSAAYADHENVLYEICNEPNGGVNWDRIKPYAEDILGVIRKNDPNAVVLVGTPNWSQFVDQAAADPITDYENVMYTLHFYAATHKEDLRRAMANAMDAGLPIFVSEYGVCDASGNGALDLDQANEWVALMDSRGVSYMNWSLANKAESASAFRSSCDKTSGFTADDLTASGRWVVTMLTGAELPPPAEDDGSPSPAGGVFDVWDLSFSIAEKNSWQADGRTFRQYDMTVTNEGSETVNGWQADIRFAGAITLSDGWNGSFTAGGDVLHVQNADYNGILQSGQSAGDVGFIVSGDGTSEGVIEVS